MSVILRSSKLVWKDLIIPPAELRLDTLKCGQSFRWKQVNDHWISVLKGKLIVLKETSTTILYGHASDEDEQEIERNKKMLRDYFQLDNVSLQSHYDRWSSIDLNFKKKATRIRGIRVLRQEPWENLISFICSSNNNITRISQMVNKLCLHYGKKVAIVDDEDFYDFPTLEAVCHDGLEQHLRELGFGYRAKYIANTAKKIKQDHPNAGEKWLYTLREKPYLEAKEALMAFSGVGPKVADCVCLMSMDHPESIPVDTHVWQIALRDYGFNKKGKALNSKLYLEIGDHFRLLFGDYSGWAHSVLFTADLGSFKEEKTTGKKRKVKDETEVQVKKEIKMEKVKIEIKQEITVKE
ncbi:DNA glycosylase [Backusella circina FSU 941]|nr:DNA glycosylase [Backusella circina FSU 941]